MPFTGRTIAAMFDGLAGGFTGTEAGSRPISITRRSRACRNDAVLSGNPEFLSGYARKFPLTSASLRIVIVRRASASRER